MTTPLLSGPFVRLWGEDNATPVSRDNPFPIIDASTNEAWGITSTTANIPTSSTTITLVQSSSKITIANYSASVILYVNYGSGAATSGNFSIAAGASFTYHGNPLQTFQVLGSGSGGTFGVCAY